MIRWSCGITLFIWIVEINPQTLNQSDLIWIPRPNSKVYDFIFRDSTKADLYIFCNGWVDFNISLIEVANDMNLLQPILAKRRNHTCFCLHMLISPGCTRPSIALQVQDRGLKHQSFPANVCCVWYQSRNGSESIITCPEHTGDNHTVTALSKHISSLKWGLPKMGKLKKIYLGEIPSSDVHNYCS